jgi:hypothetical protein
MSYRRTQWGPWAILLYGLGISAGVLAWVLRHEPPVPFILAGVSVIMLVLAPSFHYLTVEDEGDFLAIRFGPLPLFRRQIRYDEIRDVAIGKTMLIEGWGIHLSLLRRGMVWNIWGRDCVVIDHHDILRLGTNDAEGLLAFLKSKKV